MKKRVILSLIAASALVAFSFSNSLNAQEVSSAKMSVGVVNFKVCVEKSKLGKAEQTAFESLKDQMVSILEKTEKELDDIAKKLSDPEHMDSLSQDAQNELKGKFQALSQELARYQNQYYQILNQANFKLIQELSTKVGDAAGSVAKAKNLTLVVNEDATFYFDPTLEITDDVIVELDKRFDTEAKDAQGQPTANPAQQPVTPVKK